MAAGKIDLAQFGPNTLRHVTASYLVAGGIPPAAIMSRAGWTSYSTFLKFYNLQMANNNWSTMIIQAAGMQGEVVGSGSCPSTTATSVPPRGAGGPQVNGKPGDLAPHGPRTSGHGKTATGSIISTAGSSSASSPPCLTNSAMTPHSAKTPCAVQGGKDGKLVPKVPKRPMNTPKPIMNRTVAPPVPPHKRNTLPGKIPLAGTSLGSCAVSSTELHLGSSATVQAGVFPRQQSPPKFGAGHKHNTLGEISRETHQPGAVQAAPACHINKSQGTDQPASKKQKVSPRPPGLQMP